MNIQWDIEPQSNTYIKGEYNVLNDPIFDEAFEAICEKYKPGHDYAIFSLCTKKRPYSASMKWKGIIKIFHSFCDLIVCSNAGVIPLEFENYYPFYSYDSDGTAEELSEYSKELFRTRITKFLQIFHWKRIAFLLNPYEGASDVVHGLPFDNVQQFPSYYVWDSTEQGDFIGYSLRYCKVLNRRCLEEIEDWFGKDIPYLKTYSTRRLASLFDVMEEIYNTKLESNVPYTKQQLVQFVQDYDGGYDRSYIYKVINGNVKGVPDYKYYIKNNEYFILEGGRYFKNDGKWQPTRHSLF